MQGHIQVSYWTSERLRAEGGSVVRPFHSAQVVNCSYELQLGPEGYVTGGEVGRKTLLKEAGAQLVIPPGQFALLLTDEQVSVPANAIGFISVKYRFKLYGLVNVSGFHVDPGFHGQLIFAVYNAGSTDVVMSRGERVFLLWLASLEEETSDTYNGSHQDQATIPNRDIMALGRPLFSPAALSDRVGRLEYRVGMMSRIATALLVAAILALAGFFFRTFVDSDRGIPQPTLSISTTPNGSPVPSPTP